MCHHVEAEASGVGAAGHDGLGQGGREGAREGGGTSAYNYDRLTVLHDRNQRNTVKQLSSN